MVCFSFRSDLFRVDAEGVVDPIVRFFRPFAASDRPDERIGFPHQSDVGIGRPGGGHGGFDHLRIMGARLLRGEEISCPLPLEKIHSVSTLFSPAIAPLLLHFHYSIETASL
jgi:hypothetical protein